MKELLKKAGVEVLADIYDNIRNGIDCEGKPFAYSRKPFYRPFDPKLYKKMGGAGGYGKLFTITQSKVGKLGFIILGGYDAFKSTVYPNSYAQFLTITGKLLRSMKVQSVNDTAAVIGFTGERNQQIAAWLNVDGAGKGKKLWKFLGITKKQEEALIKSMTDEATKIVVEKLGKIVDKSNLKS